MTDTTLATEAALVAAARLEEAEAFNDFLRERTVTLNRAGRALDEVIAGLRVELVDRDARIAQLEDALEAARARAAGAHAADAAERAERGDPAPAD